MGEDHYVAPDGTRIERGPERDRLEAMAVPPAYEDVWMTPRENGHLWASGRDARSRKQYRYHPDWRLAREATKPEGLAAFGAALPRIRGWADRALDGDPGDFDTALAVVLSLMDRASLRVGAQHYARENQTFGATTLEGRHVKKKGDAVLLDYRAKGGEPVHKRLHGRRLDRAIHRCADLSGATLATWIDASGASQPIRSEQVNERISDLSDGAGTAKTFRTWNGTFAAFRAALETSDPTIKLLSKAASEVLHNSPTIARNSHIHPRVIDLASSSVERREALRDAPDWTGKSHQRAGESRLIEFLE
ncbi:MAG: DNA topoisomerase IB [Rhodobacteraceae bacterium]|nr:DNA topoisomerase IB [Paracoccaceae bacterium]